MWEQHWLTEHSSRSPLAEQFDELLARLAQFPEIGLVARRWQTPVRRCVLRCGWSVYYEYFAADARVHVTAIWHSARGEMPRT